MTLTLGEKTESLISKHYPFFKMTHNITQEEAQKVYHAIRKASRAMECFRRKTNFDKEVMEAYHIMKDLVAKGKAQQGDNLSPPTPPEEQSR